MSLKHLVIMAQDPTNPFRAQLQATMGILIQFPDNQSRSY